MAELDVRPKKKSPWWIWLLVLAIILALVFYFINRNQDTTMDDVEIEDETGAVETEKVPSYVFGSNTHLLSIAKAA